MSKRWIRITIPGGIESLISHRDLITAQIRRGYACVLIVAIVCLAVGLAGSEGFAADDQLAVDLFAKKNLVAWCIVPFDSKKRGPEDRAAMLEKLGFTRFAYDYRAEHIPTFDAEIEALKRHHVELTAWWFPSVLNDEAKMTLAIFEKHHVTPQLWVTGHGPPTKSDEEQRQRVRDEAARIRPIVEAAAKIGCQVALYNHGGWFGEPENQIAIITELNLSNVGIVYNLHHGHDHLSRFPELLQKMKPHLLALNLNGMVLDGERKGQKILQLGQGDLDLEILKTIRHSGYKGIIGILGHTMDDAEERLNDNLDGLEWLKPQLDGKPAGPRPKPRTPVPLAQAPQADAAVVNLPRLVEGKFGQGLNARAGGAMVMGRAEFNTFPITVECWAKLNDSRPYNILIANHDKSSGAHWELFSMVESGNFTVYVPGFAPDHCHSNAKICDDKWHHLAMILEPTQIRLLVDGKVVAQQNHQRNEVRPVLGHLAIGTLVDREFGCAGVVDEVRISRGVRPIDAAPDKPFETDKTTLALWHLDEAIDQKRLEDATKKSPAFLIPTATNQQAGGRLPKIEGHWGEDALGFRWTEEGSRDDRFGQMDTGPFFCGSITGPGGVVYKGIVVRLGDKRTASVCYDTELMRVSAGWSGFLRFDAARFGIIVPPRINGDLTFANPQLAGFTRSDQFWNFRETHRLGLLPKSQAHYEGLYRHGKRIVLKFRIGAVNPEDKSEPDPARMTEILESPWFEESDGAAAISRTLRIGPSAAPLSMLVSDGAARAQIVSGQNVAQLREEPGKPHVLFIPAHTEPITVKLLIAAKTVDESAFVKLAANSPPPENLLELIKPGPGLWGEPLVTVGEVAKNSSPFAVDTITIPFENRFNALMFCGGHDFLPDGRAYVCTLHGDVWLVDGIDDSLKRITWRRFATGLFQPLGVKVVPSGPSGKTDLYVVGRDQISRLHDMNGDGEADFYENFNNDAYVSLNGHEYVTCLETDRAGNFYYLKGNCSSATPHDGSLLQVSRDGSKLEVYATGFRNANGLGMGPNDEITVAPQEGEWTPGSCVFDVLKGGFYGMMGSHHRADPPTDFERPFVWFPRLADNSCGGQVWVPAGHWGSLAGHLLHLSYGQSKMRLLLQENLPTDASQAPFTAVSQKRSPLVRMNGGSTEFPMSFASGVHRGRFHAKDGHLYLTGLKGWVTNAVTDGCFQRVRYTGLPADLLLGMKTYRNGVALSFSEYLNRDQVENVDNYQIEAWNYHWSASYGSPDLRASAPGQIGRDTVEPKSVTLLEDRKTVFIELPDLKPVDQLGIAYSFINTAGAVVEQTAYLTINGIPDESMPDTLLHRSTSDVERAQLLARLGQGLALTTGPGETPTIRRLMAWPAAGTDDKPVQISGVGYLKVPRTTTYLFSSATDNSARLEIQGQTYEIGRQPTKVRLNKGFSLLRLTQATTARNSQFRMMWESDYFPREAIPPTSLFHEKTPEELHVAANLILGRQLLAKHKCLRCHQSEPHQSTSIAAETKLEQIRQSPQLQGIGTRINPDWLVAWLMNPAHLRSNATMPSLFPQLGSAPGNREVDLADLTAYLLSLRDATETSVEPLVKESDSLEKRLELGTNLYEKLGCISCHTFAPTDPNPDWNRVSLHYIGAKYRPGFLERFLRNPHRRHQGSRMPDFQLNEKEAAGLATYLEKNANGTLKPVDQARSGNSERGKLLFAELRCDRCHQINPGDPLGAPNVASIFNVKPQRGCLNDDGIALGKAPEFHWSQPARDALRSFLTAASSGNELIAHQTQPKVSQLLHALRCTVCHSRDGSSSLWPEIVSEEGSGRLTETLPQLTWAGEKLQGPWIEQLLKGEIKQKARPWLFARMPAFPDYAELISQSLADEHGVNYADPTLHDLDPNRIELGRLLTLRDGGLDCRQCHGLGKEQPTGDTKTQIALGINFAMVRNRLRPDFAIRQLLDPPRYDSGSRMPRFAPDLKTTAVKQIEGGDARKQFDALRQYLWSIQTDPATDKLK